MAASMAFTYEDGYDGAGVAGNVRKVIVDWVSDSGGASAGTSRKIVGMLLKAVTVPGAGGAAPTDNYDIVITDEQANNVLGTCKVDLQNRDTATTELTDLFVVNQDTTVLSTGRGPVVANALTVTISNAGSGKSGQIILYYAR